MLFYALTGRFHSKYRSQLPRVLDGPILAMAAAEYDGQGFRWEVNPLRGQNNMAGVPRDMGCLVSQKPFYVYGTMFTPTSAIGGKYEKAFGAKAFQNRVVLRYPK